MRTTGARLATSRVSPDAQASSPTPRAIPDRFTGGPGDPRRKPLTVAAAAITAPSTNTTPNGVGAATPSSTSAIQGSKRASPSPANVNEYQPKRRSPANMPRKTYMAAAPQTATIVAVMSDHDPS